MQFQSFQIFAWSLYILVAHQFGFKPILSQTSDETLILTHVLFRHGNRTANGAEELYPNDPYLNETYFPIGLGQLTNAGKMKEFNLGKSLRKKYNTFLGPYYYPEIVESWSTDYNRTKMSLELVLAGLFPPVGDTLWNKEIFWQPIPYNYRSKYEDEILLGVLCPYYLKLYQENLESPAQRKEIEKHQDLFNYISQNSGLNITKIEDVYNLNFGLTTEEEWGFKLPQWTDSVREKIATVSIQEYFVSTATTQLNQMANGYLLKKIMEDTWDKINNTNSGRKIFLYSAHENNVAEMMIALNVFDSPHIPDYGAYLVFEVHQIKEQYGIKILYENYTGKGPQLLKLPACEEICEINKFKSLIEEIIP